MRSLRIKRLKAINFRNLSSRPMSFSTGINCISGENGNGKTNILEAISLITTRKSFRKNTSFPQYLGLDGERPEIHLSAVFEGEEGEAIPCSGRLWAGGGEWYWEGRKTIKRPLIGLTFVHPFDGEAFHKTPSVRRNWMDDHLSQLNPIYRKKLSKYLRALRLRNALLAERPLEFREQVKAIDSEMVPVATEVTELRRAFLKEMAPFMKKIFQDLFDSRHELVMTLETLLIDSNPLRYARILEENFSKDESARGTSYGIHRDDYVFLLDGLNAFDYCSLGQQKMAYLWLVFAFVELFKYKWGHRPIVLLDDVSGELDKVRWMRFVNYLEKASLQIFITTANDRFERVLDQTVGAHKILVQSGMPQLV